MNVITNGCYIKSSKSSERVYFALASEKEK